MPSLKYVDNASFQTVTLGSNYIAAGTSLVLVSGHGARLPSSGDFWLISLTTPANVFKVSANAADTLTVIGGQCGRADINVGSGVELAWDLTGAALDQLRADITADLSLTGAYAALPAAGSPGRLYRATDSPYSFRDDGSAWAAYWMGRPVKSLPAALGLTLNNGSLATADQSSGAYSLAKPATSSYDATSATAPLIGQPYTIILGYTSFLNGAGANQAYTSLVLRKASTGALWFFGNGVDFGNNFSVISLSNPTTYGGDNPLNFTYGQWLYSPFRFIKLVDNGTNWLISIGVDGKNWVQVYSMARNHTFTPDEYGIGVNSQGGGLMIQMTTFDLGIYPGVL